MIIISPGNLHKKFRQLSWNQCKKALLLKRKSKFKENWILLYTAIQREFEIINTILKMFVKYVGPGR